MSSLTPQGLVVDTLPEILEGFNTKLKLRVDPLWDDRANNLINIFSGIVSEVAADVLQAAQGAYDASYAKSASDLNLDNVSDNVNVQRLPATKSSGSVEFTGTLGSVIPLGTLLYVNGTETKFFTTSAMTLDATSFSDVTIETTAVTPSVNYSLTINNTSCIVASGLSPTANSILVALKALIDANVAGVTTSLPTSTSLRINVTEVNSVFPLTIGARLGATSVSNIVGVESEFTGVTKAPVGSLNILPVPVSGITSVVNNVDIKEGRVRETDSELRVRRYQSVGNIGASTLNALTSNLRSLENVTAAFIIQNKTYVVDADGRPPKSFECVVEGGDEQEIADTILAFAPVGIEPCGAITRTSTDLDGNELSISFSRPSNVYIKVNVEYSKYDEELFAATGEEGIRSAVLTYGSSLNIGNDVIPQRFFGGIFSTVQGIQSLSVEIAESADGVTWSPLTSGVIPINRTEATVFSVLNINVAEV